jgi:hypothetical protein
LADSEQKKKKAEIDVNILKKGIHIFSKELCQLLFFDK